MKILNSKVRFLLLTGVEHAGSYEYEEVFPYIEASLTPMEYLAVQGFLSWCVAKGQKFGHGNIDQQFAIYRGEGGL